MKYTNLLDRFLRYVKIDTQSDDESETYPTTSKQLDLARLLFSELKDMGLKDVSLDDYSYVMATLPANTDKKVPVIGFISHIDTSPDMSGANVNPQIIKNYDGKDIILNKEKDIVLSLAEFPELKKYAGQTLITTDGNTLLGADDKAGVTEIMTALEFLVANPSVKHGTVRVCFTPDEEVGKGVDKFDVEKFNADFAYTLDGGAVGELEYENFNAAIARIAIQGRNIHPGYAKNKMLNSILIAIELNDLLPIAERPELTVDYEGFFHIIKLDGNVEAANMQYIIRDHDKQKFEKKKLLMTDACEFINKKYGRKVVILDLKDQYYNMKEKIEPVMHIVETARKAIELAGVKPDVIPIRGGTDGARLSFMGLPCPNIFAGGHNFHGKLEYVPFESMEKAVDVILNILKLYTDK
jgi:tripeptide aminopeptidase